MAPARMQTVLTVLSHHISAIGARFLRRRCWTPERIMAGLIMLVSRPGITSIESLMPALAAAFDLPSVPSDSTFVEARRKFARKFPSAMRDLWQRLVAQAVTAIPESRRMIGDKQWIAVDGTWAWAPHEAGNVARWGRPKSSAGKKLHYPQLLMVTALDVLTRVPLAATLLPHDGSERAGLRAFLDIFRPGTVLMADRGFPAKDLIVRIMAQGGDILWRMGTAEANSWNCVHGFLRDRAKPREAIVDLPTGAVDAQGNPILIKIRLIRRVFKRGRPRRGQTRETMVLMTTLLDAQAWPIDRLIAMYERRWAIETWYRDLKVRFGMESFHSRSEQLIEQEIMALLAWLTLCAILERNVYARIERSRGKQDPEDPKRFQISTANLVSAAARIFSRLLVMPDITAVLAASELDLKWLDSTARRRRPGRSNPRARKAPHGRFIR